VVELFVMEERERWFVFVLGVFGVLGHDCLVDGDRGGKEVERTKKKKRKEKKKKKKTKKQDRKKIFSVHFLALEVGLVCLLLLVIG
jgi:hypothetical protein